MLERIRKAKDEGFTLIELLIVIIILGILAAIVVFAVGSTRSDSVQATCKTDIKSVQLAAESVKTKQGSYPASQADLSDATKGGLLKGWPGGTDAANDDLVFVYSQSGSGYSIAITGKNYDTSTAGLVTKHTVTDSMPDSATGNNPSITRACTNDK